MDSLSNTPLGEPDQIRVQKLSHAVADRLRGQIVSGQRKAGDRLPPESEMLTQFKVSRPTIREALRILEVESLISLGRGARAGATVLTPTVERAAEYAAMVLVSSGTTVGELHDARAVLEPPMVQQLIKKRDRALMDGLQTQLDLANHAVQENDFTRASECVNEFHSALVRASANRALILMVEMLKVLSKRTVDTLAAGSSTERTSLRANMIKTTTAYQQLLDLMRAGKAEDAQTFWLRYMEKSGALLEKSGLGSKRLLHPGLV